MGTRLLGLKKENDKNKQLYDELFVSDSNYRLVSSTPKAFSAIHKDDFGENFYISEEELDYYIDGFIESVLENVPEIEKATISEASELNQNNESGLDDYDVKLSLYRSFKSLNDKWIISSNYSGDKDSRYFYDNNKFNTGDTKLLIEYFSFVNRCGTDIGKKAVIDFSYLSNLASTKNGEGPTKTLYESLTGVLNKNNFNFYPLPSFVTYSDSDLTPLTDMFRAMDGPLDNIHAEPNFVCMFIGGNSRSLDIPRSYCGVYGTSFEYTNDSFDINDPTSYPEDFRSGGGINAFKVRYGQETQNHFSRIELDQAEFKETQDALLVIDALVNPSSGSDPTQIGKGNNIYDVNLTRSYVCSVESLGNMQIQPMMFFKLENVPMFRGTYLITDVSHSIKPHNVKTTFKGARQPIVTVPIVTEALSLLDLALTEVAPPTPPATPSQDSVNNGFNNYDSVNVGEYKGVPDFDLFVYLAWQQGQGGAAQHYSLWKGNGKYSKYSIEKINIKSNWPSGYQSATGVKASDIENLYNTDQKKLAEAFVDVQRQLYNSKRNTALQLLNSSGENRTGIKYSEIKSVFQKYAKPNEGLTYESLAAFGMIENGLNTDSKDSNNFKGLFQINKTDFADILNNLSPKTGHKPGFTDWVPLDLYVQLCIPRVLSKFKSFAKAGGFGS